MTKVVSNKRQMLHLVKLMEENLDVARAVISKNSAKEKWEEFSIELNKLGPPQRDWEKWQRVWRDLKAKVRKKAYEQKEDTRIYGIASNKYYPLSQMEEMVASILELSSSMDLQEDVINLDENRRRTSTIIEEMETVQDSNSCIENTVENVCDEFEPASEKSKLEGKRLNKELKMIHNDKRLDLLKEQINSQNKYRENASKIMGDFQKSLESIGKYTKENYFDKKTYRECKLDFMRKKIDLLEQEIKNNEDEARRQEIYRKTKLEMKNNSYPTQQTENNIETSNTDSTLQLLTETKNTHKMILENVRDIKMKLFMQKKSTHCEDCSSTNKDMLAVQNQILEVQQKNLNIQMQIIEEIKKLSEHFFYKTDENNSKSVQNENLELNCNSESDDGSNSDEDPLSNIKDRKRIKLE